MEPSTGSASPLMMKSEKTQEEETHLVESPKQTNKEASSEEVERIKSRKEERVVELAECARERLKKHRQEMAGRVWIPDIWGQEGLLKDCNVQLDRSLVPKGLLSAREALVQECRRSARPLRANKSC